MRDFLLLFRPVTSDESKTEKEMLSKNELIMICFTVLLVNSPGNSKEHSLKVDIGSTVSTRNGYGSDVNVMGTLQYQYQFSNNVVLGIKHIHRQGKEYQFITSTGPTIGYTLYYNQRLFSEFESGLGLNIAGEGGFIPSFGPLVTVSPSLYYSISKWIAIGIRYGIVYEFSYYDYFLHDFSITSRFSIGRK